MIKAQVNFKSSITARNHKMDIAEVAKASGLPASTLRFYEEKGLIQSIAPFIQRQCDRAAIINSIRPKRRIFAG